MLFYWTDRIDQSQQKPNHWIHLLSIDMASRAFLKRWCGDPAVWPIIGTMGLACTLVGYHCGRYVLYSPDVRWDKKARSEILRRNHDEGEKFSQHFETLAAMKENVTRKQREEINRAL